MLIFHGNCRRSLGPSWSSGRGCSRARPSRSESRPSSPTWRPSPSSFLFLDAGTFKSVSHLLNFIFVISLTSKYKSLAFWKYKIYRRLLRWVGETRILWYLKNGDRVQLARIFYIRYPQYLDHPMSCAHHIVCNIRMHGITTYAKQLLCQHFILGVSIRYFLFLNNCTQTQPYRAFQKMLLITGDVPPLRFAHSGH